VTKIKVDPTERVGATGKNGELMWYFAVRGFNDVAVTKSVSRGFRGVEDLAALEAGSPAIKNS